MSALCPPEKTESMTAIEPSMSDGRGKAEAPVEQGLSERGTGCHLLGLMAMTSAALVARRFRDLVHQVTQDLGGPDALSENQRQIIRRIASMSVWCESEEAKMADGAEIDIDKFQRTSNSLRRFCETIGLTRVAKDVELDLKAYLEATASRKKDES